MTLMHLATLPAKYINYQIKQEQQLIIWFGPIENW